MPKTSFHLDNVVSKTQEGLAPQLPNEESTTKYLRQDGTWQIPPDTNTWRPVQNNLTSESTDDSLSAKQGKVLNDHLVPSMLDVQNKSYTSGSIDDLPCGIYRIYNSVTQIPITVAGYCSCYLRENGTKLQVYTSDTNRTFTRTKVSGTWSNWEELALNSNIVPKERTVTLSSNISGYSGVFCMIIGKICLIQMSIELNSNAQTGAELFSGAPVPFGNTDHAFGSLTSSGKSLKVGIDNNGVCTIKGSPGTNVGWLNGVMAYVTI